MIFRGLSPQNGEVWINRNPYKTVLDFKNGDFCQIMGTYKCENRN
jgi:hypothetical protein